MKLHAYLREHLLVGDGAMGTYLHQQGIPLNYCTEELNVTHPELVEKVHLSYLKAGAQVIETNTYGANRERLFKYGLEERVEELNRAGVQCARQALCRNAPLASGPFFLLGAVGGIRGGKIRNFSSSYLQEVYFEQIQALLGEGVDGVVLETFSDLEELELALYTVRKLDAEISVVAQLSVTESGYTEDGVPLSEAFLRLYEEGADVVGLNCYSGPYNMIQLIEDVRAGRGNSALPQEMIFSAYPNAGLPGYVDGKYVYASSPEYFAKSALRFRELGVRMIGGCCGTTPAHVSAIAKALSEKRAAAYGIDLQVANFQDAGFQGVGLQDSGAAGRQDDCTGQGQDERIRCTSLTLQPVFPKVTERAAQDSGAGGLTSEPTLVELTKVRHTVIVELDPPKGLDIETFLEGAYALKEASVDALTMADNSLAMPRMSNMALGAIVKEQVELRPLLHLSCRDRNLIGQQSHLMGLNALGIDHVLAVTGDPTRYGDLPGAASVYDVNAFELIRMIKQLNDGLSFSGRPMKQKARFTVGAALNPNVKNLDKAIQRMEKKIVCGADFIMTQPVYDRALIRELAERTRAYEVPVFLGIMPLTSFRNAEFLHNEVPGIQLSGELLARMARYEGEDARKEGVEIALELLEEGVKHFRGIYLITPFLRYEMTVALSREVLRQTEGDKNALLP